MVGTIPSSRLIKYILLQTTIGPSLICDFLVFRHFIRHWRQEFTTSPHNHVILCLLIVSFSQKISDAPLLLYYLRWGIVPQQTNTFCAMWNWLDDTSITVALHLVTWCCIERHLFVFHSQMMKRKCCLILFHYIPLTVSLIYVPLFYVSVIFFPKSCINVWQYTCIFCGNPCYSYNPFLGSFDWLFHNALPILIILIANLLFFYRIVRQKLKQQRLVGWNRQRRLIIQLVFISSLHLILMLPQIIVGVIQALWSPTFLIDIQYNYFYYIPYFIDQFLPFVIVLSLPKMYKDLKQWMERIRRGLGVGIRIHPAL